MPSSSRIMRVHRLRSRLREEASADLARRVVHVATIERALGAAHEAADDVRSAAAAGADTGAAFVLAWAYADGLARRATGLLDDRVRALTAAKCARDVVAERRRGEEQLARLATRIATRVARDEDRAQERQSDELALWAHGRTR